MGRHLAARMWLRPRQVLAQVGLSTSASHLTKGSVQFCDKLDCLIIGEFAVIADIAVALLASIAGFITALWLLLLWIGESGSASETECILDPILGARDQAAIYASHSSFIPMPDHLKTRDEMVTWMTEELPKLTADAAKHKP
jgi:hypothetical protein